MSSEERARVVELDKRRVWHPYTPMQDYRERVDPLVVARASDRSDGGEAVGEFDAEALLKSWLPGGAKSLEELQKSFWAGFTGAGDAPKKDKK